MSQLLRRRVRTIRSASDAVFAPGRGRPRTVVSWRGAAVTAPRFFFASGTDVGAASALGVAREELGTEVPPTRTAAFACPCRGTRRRPRWARPAYGASAPA